MHWFPLVATMSLRIDKLVSVWVGFPKEARLLSKPKRSLLNFNLKYTLLTTLFNNSVSLLLALCLAFANNTFVHQKYLCLVQQVVVGFW